MELTIRGVIDDRIPGLGWPRMWSGTLKDVWEEMMAQEAQSLRELIEAAADALGVTGTVDVQRGRASASLLVLSEDVDLLVIASRRWDRWRGTARGHRRSAQKRPARERVSPMGTTDWPEYCSGAPAKRWSRRALLAAGGASSTIGGVGSR